MENILNLVDQGKYTEAIEMINRSSEEIQDKGRIIMAKADSKYELGLDLEALEDYVSYLIKYPSGHGKNFALIGIVVCLKNLELYAVAKQFIEMIDDVHEGKEKEMNDANRLIEKQNIAREIIGTLLLRSADE